MMCVSALRGAKRLVIGDGSSKPLNGVPVENECPEVNYQGGRRFRGFCSYPQWPQITQRVI
jgi:hypothetical protein